MILDEIAAKTRERIKEEKRSCPPAEMRRQAEQLPVSAGFPFEQALRMPGLSFICEIKQASPSKGIIVDQFPYLEIAKSYEAAGASAISVLTEPYYFMGSDRYLEEVVQTVKIPVLRKDFTVDPYMIYQAKCLGASAILLICAILEDGELREYQDLASGLGLSVLTEAHDENEVERALNAGARIIGVNNRNLKNFEVDLTNSARLRSLVPPEVVFVSESGIRGPKDTQALYQNGTDAVLIGEMLMRSQDKQEMLNRLRQTGKESGGIPGEGGE